MYAAAAISFVSAEGKEFFIIFTLQPSPPPTQPHASSKPCLNEHLSNLIGWLFEVR